MHIRRVLTLAVAVVTLAGAPVLVAQQNNNRRDQEKRSQQQQRDIQALVQLIDAVSTGKQPAPTDIAITWESNHVVKGADGSTYSPLNVAIDASKLPSPAAAMYVRVVSKEPAPKPGAADQNNRDKNKAAGYPWDNVYFLDVPPSGRVARAVALKPGEYEVFIAVKEQSPKDPPRNQPPAKVGLLRHDLSIPDFNGPNLTTSSILLASAIEELTAPLTAEQQRNDPYAFGAMRAGPTPDFKMKKGGELQVLFWVYGVQQTGGKPDIQIEYSFHNKTAEGEKYFNKTAPQMLNATTLPPQFDMAAGHQVPGSLVVPLTSFPEGDYRLEIKVTDKASGKTLTENASFTVES